MTEQTCKCGYCGAERPMSELKQGRVIYRTRRNDGFGSRQVVAEKTNWYCKDKGCHGYDQMAHEG